MRVDAIEFGRAGVFQSETVELPAKGIVLVTGRNGQGKSTLIEGVAAAAWGKTLRGTPWFRKEGTSTIGLRFNGRVHVVRTRKGERNLLEFDVKGEPKVTYDTAAKGQVALAPHLGTTFDTWRRISVFTSESLSADSFADSADADRKRMVESLMGLDRFDPAAEACHGDLRAAMNALQQAQRIVEIAAVKVEAEEQRIEDAVARRSALPTGQTPKQNIEAIDKRIAKFETEISGLRTRLRVLDSREGQWRAELASIEARRALIASDECPSCTQTIPEDLHAKLEAEHAAQEERVKADAKTDEAQREQIGDDLDDAREMLASVQSDRAAQKAALNEYQRAKSESARLEALIADATLKVTTLRVQRAEAAEAIGAAEKEQGTLEAVSTVLGLQGVRASLLTQTLEGIADLANRWLSRMGGLQIRLKSQREGSKRAIAEVGLDVEGAGGGFGYRACSRGEQRRINVALLVAFAKVAQAAHGLAPGTLFFDEVMDVLDDQGVAGIAAAIEDLAQDRCVVVVSHSEGLQSALRYSMHLCVDDGRIFEV